MPNAQYEWKFIFIFARFEFLSNNVIYIPFVNVQWCKPPPEHRVNRRTNGPSPSCARSFIRLLCSNEPKQIYNITLNRSGTKKIIIDTIGRDIWAIKIAEILSQIEL